MGASPTRDEITQAVKNLWTGDPWQYTEITVRVLGEVENIRAWNEKADMRWEPLLVPLTRGSGAMCVRGC